MTSETILSVVLIVLAIAHTGAGQFNGVDCKNAQPSTRPMFSNVPGTKIIQNTAGSGDVVYQVYCVQNAAAAAPITLEIMNSPPFKITGPPEGTIVVDGALTPQIYAVDILCCDDQGYDRQTLYVHCRLAPTFLNIPTTISILETTPVQTSIFAVQASNNGYASTSWTYLIVPQSNTFQIDALTGVVSLTQQTDFESVPNTYSLVITATDNNNFISTSTLTVSITDVCGQPIFQGTPYVANIVEGTYGSAIFFQTSQYLEEKLTPPTISITSMVPANTIFTVASASTGTIQYNSPTFNQDTTPEYLITLQLANTCGTDTAVLAVKILEKDPPTLTASGSTTVTISEQLPGGTNVAGFTMTCDDATSTAATVLSLCCTPYTAYFTINAAGNAIVAGSPLLYYADMYSITGSPVSFPLTLIATLTRTDGKSLVTQLQYTIIITEIEVDPVFNPNMGYVTVPEQQPAGTVVNNFFSATDANVNNALTYSMVPSTGSSNFNFIETPQPHLTTAVTFTYQGLSPSQWVFTFTAVDVTSRTATYTMTVSVVPINNIPKFVPDTGTVSIVENQATGLSVFQFSCTDLNTSGTLTYSIIQSTYSQNFVIVNNSPTADLHTNWVFDYYTMPQTTFNIQVMCMTTGHLFDIYTLTVTITPIAWPPYFDPSSGSGTVKEQLAAGTDINTYFPCKNKNPADTFTYAIVSQPPDSTYFQIETSPSPHLQTTTVFDYFSMSYNVFTLKITAVDQNTLTATYTITVSVLPVNQPPGFNPTSDTISINERQAVGTEVPYNFTATKQNPTDVLTYSIIPSAYSNYFTLQPTPAAHLLTNIVFDYDTMIPSTHTVVVYIKCLSSSGLSSVFTLTVNILRIDKPPVLSPSSTCQTTLDEKLPIGTTVNCFFTATDPQGASLTYTLVPSTYSPNFNLILGTTNHFTTAVSFTYNTMPQPLLPLTVNVSDSVGQSTLYTVQVQVLQVNTAPTFTPSIGTANVPEGQASGYVVATYFPAVDAQNDIVSYYLEPAPCSDYFAIATTPSPHLVTTKIIDIDTVPTTTPTFFIRGQDPAGLYNRFQLDVTITPIQHVPVCLPATCQTNINEDVPLGSPLTSCVMTATDPDGDSLVFTLGATPTYPGQFALNTGTATTRTLVTSTLFDYYTMTLTTFTYIVTATDPASNACSFTVTVTINPVPHAPVFNPITCSDTIPSNQPAGLVVSGCTFQATDVNTGDSISYSIVTAQYSNLFAVQTTPTPQLVTTELIDYPTMYPTTSITVTIMAKDTSGLSATFTEIVTLTQTNLPPSFNPNTCSVNVAEYQPINSVVNCYFSATDRNIGDSVTYSMPASPYFNLVTTSGKPHLTTAQVFNYYTLSQLTFTQVITATDLAGATDTFTLTISITYVLIAPYFLIPSETVTHGDGQPANTIIPLNMTTYFDMMDTVTYSIVPSQYSSYFKLSSTTGYPFLLQAVNFDYYQMGNPSLTIQAQVLSTKTGQLGLKLITVDVYPVNTAPKLNVTSGSVTIDEMLPIGTWVPFGFTATDREGGPLNYSISSTDAPGYFALNTQYPTATNPARLLVNDTIDYDSPTLINPIHLVITVTDNGTLTNSLTLTITIQPTYKLAPVFTNSSCNATIAGNSLVGTSLFTLSATDPNVNMPTPPIRYTLASITAIPNKYFTVGIQSGAATIGYPIPNVAATYVLNATTYNQLKPYLSSSRLCYVTTTVIIVTTTTEAPAVYNSSFSMAFYNFEIRADANIGDYAGTVKAIRDGTSPMPIQYYMTSGSTYTTVGISSGWLKLAQYVTADQEYIQYCSCIDTGTKDGLLSCIQFRLDVYSASQYLVNITVDKPTADFTPAVLQDFITKLTSAIRAQLPDAYPRLVYLDGYTVALDGTITSPTTVPNLQTTNITIVILKGTYTDNIANITNAKQYYYATDVLPSVLDTKGQPNSGFSTMKTKYPITKIVPYKYQTVPAKPVNWWLETTPGLITVGGLCLLGLLGITAAIAVPAALACRKRGAENALRNANKGRPSHNYTEAPEPDKPARTWDSDPEPRPPTNKPNSVPPTRQEMSREPSVASRRSQLTDVDYDSRPNSIASADNVSLYLRDSNSRFAMPSCRYVNRLH